MFIGHSGSNNSVFLGNTCEPKLHPFLVHMRMYKGVVLLYDNIRTLQNICLIRQFEANNPLRKTSISPTYALVSNVIVLASYRLTRVFGREQAVTDTRDRAIRFSITMVLHPLYKKKFYPSFSNNNFLLESVRSGRCNKKVFFLIFSIN